jgi:hypothetical protein
MVTPLVLVLALLLGQPTPESLDLPPGVKGMSEWVNDKDAFGQPTDEIFSRNYFEIAWDWVRGEQHMDEGSLGGWAIRYFDIDTMNQTLRYYTQTAKGMLDRQLSIMGHSACEMDPSPIGWLRTLHVRKANGEKIDVHKDGRHTVYSCGRAYNQGRLFVYVDESTKQIDKAVLTWKNEKDSRSVYEYLDWAPLPGGYHHPRRTVVRLSGPNPKLDISGTTFVREIEVLPEDAEPTPYSFPERARFIDNIDHVTRNGLMEVIGPIEPDPPSPKATSARRGLRAAMANPRNWFVWGGVGALLLAAVAWRLKQRGIIA